ncbi:Leucine-rich repeat protein [Dioscorea alata]|uniref:Leucine-rich repeat protein n=1 Tax=Dioscorea alata TaxID=55571 RepID=A0ACB7V7A9_DIOAL|nr:Leucine-rich repeat protein [Dioscorea alata]
MSGATRMMLLLLLVILVLAELISRSSCTACIESERMALLDFKKHVQDPNNKLSSWVMGQDCCSWEGAHCDNLTGNILALKLRGPDPRSYVSYYLDDSDYLHYLQLGGEISPSLLQLQHLNYLDLSCNFFDGTSIPSFISQFKELRYLNLSYSGFHGSIPAGFGNLSSLHTLDLSYNDGVYVDDPDHPWLSHLSSLQHLVVSGVIFGSNSSSSLFLALNKLPSIKEIRLSECELQSIPLFIPHINFSSLSILDLSHNSINFSVSSFVFKVKSLQYLDLSNNHFDSNEHDYQWLSHLASLQHLDMSGVNLSSILTHLHLSSTELKGDIPDWIGDIKNLKLLDLSHNSLSGSIPSSLALLSFLEKLLLNDNQLSGAISEEPFTHLGNLKTLDMSSNSLVFNASANWVPPFLLNILKIRSCLVGPEFPMWLQTQHKLNVLDMSQNRISSTVPDWFWNLTTSNLIGLNLSSNQIQGMIPKFLTFTHMANLDLSSNLFSGPLPNLHMNSPIILDIDLSNNSFSVGGIDFSKNHLSGELPDCWSNSTTLSNINLAYNDISGAIPSSISHLSKLKILLLNHNKMSGELPDSLKNCSQLWNAFVNHIPQEISQLKDLQILDLSNNNLSGPIPKSLSNLTAMQMLPENACWRPHVIQYKETLSLSFRGRDDEYNEDRIGYINYIDFSNNELSGNIPEEFGSLYGLQTLNLSGNFLEGEIPDKLGRMQQLELLDLSRNKLSGSIPATLSNLTFLEHFNVSYNNLSGRIPSRNQFNTFNDSSIYIGNHLCGYPLSDNCTKDGGITNEELNDGKDEDDGMLWVYIGSMSGFAVGFWTVFGVLAFKKNWRHVYFNCIDNMYDKVYVYVVVSFARIRIKMMLANN